MTAEEKRAKEKEYLEKYNIRVTYSDTPILDNTRVYFSKKLERANKILKKVHFPEGFFNEPIYQ
ncbi:hypothetical protein [Capnocytophaga leadbetteri]|uniref:hypothetical protein n=1 Tax=Capnocytophaga leadbetteri TaxID=327575 RepID=UPI0028E5BC0D|nr:hypothetical protein [Capnocytophaga leadbetteri]